MLDQSELAQLQADAYQAACDLPCVVSRRGARVPSASGGNTAAYGPVPQPNFPSGLLAGMSQPTAGQLQNFGYLVGSKAAWQVKTSVLANILELDYLTINGENLEVVKDLTPRSYPSLLTLLCAEVK